LPSSVRAKRGRTGAKRGRTDTIPTDTILGALSARHWPRFFLEFERKGEGLGVEDLRSSRS